MPVFFQCSKKFLTGNDLFQHFRSFHNLTSNSTVSCGEPSCIREFSCFNSLRKHLGSKHPEPSYVSGSAVGLSQDANGGTNDTNDQNNTSRSNNGDDSSPPHFDAEMNEALMNLTEFKSSIEQEVLVFIAECYRHKIRRKDVDFIVQSTNNFLGGDFLNILQQKVVLHLQNLNEKPDNIQDIIKMFDWAKNLLRDCLTEHKRLKFFDRKGVLIRPQDVIVGEALVSKTNSEERTILVSTDVKVKWIPMRDVLTKYLSIPEVLNVIREYMQILSPQNEVLSNFVQGDLWKTKLAGIDDRFVLPLFLYFDDFETGNALGSHAGVNKLGAMYYSIPCLPPEYQSTLDNIFLALLFYSGDRVEYGNERVFNVVSNELKYLWEEGIEIKNCDGTILKVHFLLGLIVGDNLGLHSILGLMESFSATYHCRFCKSPKNVTKTMFVEDMATLRTLEEYQQDVNLPPQETGIKQACIWHEAPKFNLTCNFSVDVMHDFYEGVCKYSFGQILYYFIIEKRAFSVEALNSRIRTFQYGPTDRHNIPPPVHENDVRKKTIRLSASEMISFLHCFPLLVGDFVPAGNEVWVYVLHLREISTILLSKSLQVETSVYMSTLISELLHSYVSLFHKDLKPKFHHLVHYPKIFRESGPLVHLWSMRFEGKHRELKGTLQGNESKVNVPHSVSVKLQLSLVSKFVGESRNFLRKSLEFGPGIFMPKQCLPPDVTSLSVDYFEEGCTTFKSVKMYGTVYKVGMALVVECIDIPLFAAVDQIFINTKNQLLFLCNPLKTMYLDEHYAAFIVCKDISSTQLCIRYEELCSYEPLTVRSNIKGQSLILLRVTL